MTGPAPSRATPSIAFVTGVDANMFGQFFLLLGSLRRNSPDAWLYVCDLGLTTPQRDYLLHTRRLLPRPLGRQLPRHAWYDKAALGAYTELLGADIVVWLDADLIIMNDIVAPIWNVCTEMQALDQVVAAAGSKELALGALDWLDDAPGFRSAMSTLDLKAPYLNSGLIICRSREFLARWAIHCDALPCELLFEQNAFNLAAYEQPGRIRPLDPWIWNLCGTGFRSVVLAPSGHDLAVIGPSGTVNILHATSTERAKDLAQYDYHLKVDETFFRPQFRVITCFEALRTYQINLVIECITAEAQALVASGVGSPGEVVLGRLEN
jgi:hypothetical protein